MLQGLKNIFRFRTTDIAPIIIILVLLIAELILLNFSGKNPRSEATYRGGYTRCKERLCWASKRFHSSYTTDKVS